MCPFNHRGLQLMAQFAYHVLKQEGIYEKGIEVVCNECESGWEVGPNSTGRNKRERQLRKRRERRLVRRVLRMWGQVH